MRAKQQSLWFLFGDLDDFELITGCHQNIWDLGHPAKRDFGLLLAGLA